MNTLLDPAVTAMPDVQSGPDTRHIAIQRVGVRGVRHPLRVAGANGSVQTTVGEWALTIALPATEKGTHMSRFIALLEGRNGSPATLASLADAAREMLDLLQADAGDITVEFPYFIEKAAPVSGVRSLMDYQLRWCVRARREGATAVSVRVQVPVTTLCPCSKAISAYGAHNQRSLVTVDLDYADVPTLDLDALIHDIETQASCELWGQLKRADEKYVTEHAYENPKFVEDLVRDVATLVRKLPGLTGHTVTAENFESIHNHSAYAVVCG